MELELKNFMIHENKGIPSRKLLVSDEVFRYPFNLSLVHHVISNYRANARQGSKSQKSRSEVSGSNKKPWRQKGTGRARSGSVKSPIWRSGGVTFAAKPKVFHKKTNRKMYKGAIKSILSKLVCDNRLFLIEDCYLNKPKTKFLLMVLKNITVAESVLIITDMLDKNLVLASRNLYNVEVRDITKIDPVSLLNFQVTFLTHSVVGKIEQQLI